MKTDTYAQTITRKIGKNLTVEISVAPNAMTMEWLPDVPKKLTPRQMARYRAARHEALCLLVERTGQPMMLVDGRTAVGYEPGGDHKTVRL